MVPKTILPKDAKPTFKFEREAQSGGALRIAGLDEAGRGPLAGPVVAAAVIFSKYVRIPEINDSKLLPEPTREKLFTEIRKKAAAIGVGVVHSPVIDEINIYQATRRAMLKALKRLEPQPDFLLVDGPLKLDTIIGQRAVIKGDRLSVSIAAAAIIAKVTRDRMMLELHDEFPQYGFDKHKGYATRQHRDALCKYGPCRIHRQCFRGVQDPASLPLFPEMLDSGSLD